MHLSRELDRGSKAYWGDREMPVSEFTRLLADACQLLAAGDLPGCP
ncbi:MAG: hypothetical protein VB076_13045 [Synergistaceae bacterium]|nr:hypothetical protein [Synergistaceae bacterium]